MYFEQRIKIHPDPGKPKSYQKGCRTVMSALVKIAVVVLVIVGIIYLLDAYWPKSDPKPQHSIYDTFKEDDEKFHADPEFNEPAEQTDTGQAEPAIEQAQYPV